MEPARGGPARAELRVDADAGAAVVVALIAVRDRFHEFLPRALADEPDALHQLRTHVRRLRSVLAAYGAVLDDAVVTELRRRLRELGHELGTVRDLEVRVQVAEAALADAEEAGRFASDAERERVRAILVDDERAAHDRAHARFVERQELPRAPRRIEELDGVLAAPPFVERAGREAVVELAKLLDREARRAAKRARRLPEDPTLDELHDLRKASRRLRYAAEAVSEPPVELFGARAADLADAGDDIHDVLGDHRDELLFAEHVRRAASHAAHAGEPAEVLHRLADDADARAAAHLAELPEVVATLRKAARAWHAHRAR
ncbi:CHAD domain-containing protein [Agromyces kandeliae]|uniref:CHAD domain-containing protein n=1 Tax=Agromyces kandeliae TaxID=2666141 RepID=UPI0018A22B6E|nr:CHAD domain-containing protein [Agromyces kandeliae]